MTKALFKTSTTAIHKGGKRTHIRFSETEPAHNEAKSAKPTFSEEDASSSHSHGLKWSSSSSIETPLSSNPVVAPSTTTQVNNPSNSLFDRLLESDSFFITILTTQITQGDQVPAGPCEEEGGGLEPQGKAHKRRRRDKKRRNENKFATKDHFEENDGSRQLLSDSAIVKDKGVIDQEEVQSAIGTLKNEHQTAVAVSAATAPATAPATKDVEEEEEEERDEQQTRGSSQRLPNNKERDVAVSMTGRSSHLSYLALFQETRLFTIQSLWLTQFELDRQVDAEGESRLRDFSRSGQRPHGDMNLSLSGLRLLHAAYDDLTLQEGDEEEQGEVDEKSLDAPTSVSVEANSTIDSRIEKTRDRTPLTSNSTLQYLAPRERQSMSYGSTSVREQVRENPSHAENANTSRCSSNFRKSWDVKAIACLDDDGDQVAEENSCSDAVQSCKMRHARAAVKHKMNTAELDGDISQEKDCQESLRAQQFQEQRRRDYVTNELIKGQQGQEEDKAEHARALENRRSVLHDRQAFLENSEETLRKEILRHEASLAELSRRL